MTAPLSPASQQDARLWAFALGLSLALNALLILLAGISILQLEKHRPKPDLAAKSTETVRIIAPELAPALPPADPALAPLAADRTPFTRTSVDQLAARPDQPSHIGERNTLATSDATPDPTALRRPAQAGVDPLYDGHIETTESRYQDGKLIPDAPLSPDPPAPPMPPVPPVPDLPPAPPESASRGQETTTPGIGEEMITPPPPERLATSSQPVDIPVPRKTLDAPPKPAPEELPKEGMPDALPGPDDLKESQPATPPKPSVKEPAFRGYQRKTALRGSISRGGRSALDVEDSPLGRYQAVISRAVELEWQRNCVRYRDFITPGYLTVRFFVDPAGKVKSVDFVGTMQTGQQQKGFTLNAIRDAAIPGMPHELRKDFKDENLELIFNFYF
ncbi:MAG: hypothetical protein K9N23_22645 [Akkermansiaceae bacterium]|nr:hypothetical protein [Akkermansiaceae bacterium]